MKFFIYFLSLHFLLFCSAMHSVVPVCTQHSEEINHIRSVAYDSLLEAHKLTGDIIGSIVVTAQDMAWDAVKSNWTYTQFSSVFRGGISHCNKKGKFLASDRLYKGFNEVGDLFLALYDNCILNHHNYRSVFERGKIYFDRGNVEACLIDMTALIDAGLADDLIKDIKPVDLLMTKAQAFLEISEYEKAIEVLSDVIKKDPKNKEAYFHRAAAYFETGQFDQALKDYLASDKGKGMAKSTFEITKDFTAALVASVCQGAADATIDFIPSFCSTTYGLGKALWATAQHPIDSTKVFASACYEAGKCFSESITLNMERESLYILIHRNYYLNLREVVNLLIIRLLELQTTEKGSILENLLVIM